MLQREISSAFLGILMMLSICTVFTETAVGMSGTPDRQEIIDSVMNTIPECPEPSTVYQKTGSFFTSCDSLLEEMADDPGVRSSDLKESAQSMADINDDFPSIKSFIRTNSKGKIIAKAEDGEVVPKSVHNFRYVGSQKWFKIIQLSKKAYYGHYTSGGSIRLFWNRPILKGNSYKGAIAAQIDLKKAFSNLAEKKDLEFEAKYRDKVVFSNLNDKSNTVTRKLPVFGIVDITLTYPEFSGTTPPSKMKKEEGTDAKSEEASAEAESPSSKPGGTKEAKEESDKPDKEKDIKKSQADEKAEKDAEEGRKELEKVTGEGDSGAVAEAEDEEGDKGGAPLGIIFVIIGILLLIAIIAFIIMAKKKRQAMMDAIDKGEI